MILSRSLPVSITFRPSSSVDTRFAHRSLPVFHRRRKRHCFRIAPRAILSGGTVFSTGEDLPVDYGEWLPKKDPGSKRRAGVILHPSSLQGPYGIGDFGEEALRFVDWLHLSGCSVWQVLPLVPPGRKSNEDGSPYAGQDANCGNTLLISLEDLVKDGLLSEDELPEPMDQQYVQFEYVSEIKDPLIAKAAKRLIASKGELKKQLYDFRHNPVIAGWLEDSALFAAIDNDINAFSWNEWPEPLKNRHLGALENIYQKYKDFDRNNSPILVSGVPPDAFSETGQLWGSPLYDWRAMEEDDFSWWVKRIKRACNLYDEFRIDHFRGFSGYWSVPYEAKTAMYGTWKAGPRETLFDVIFKAVGKINIIAEDLGIITEDVVQLRKAIGAPGMSVLQFAFGSGADNAYLPHNNECDQVVYTGTHDNDTSLGWWENMSNPKEKDHVKRYLNVTDEDNIPWALIRSALSSVAQISMVPMQDILCLGSGSRMNTPATQKGNWRWRIPSTISFDTLKPEAEKLRDLLLMYNRL